MRVLIIEDDDALRDLWHEVYTQAGHDATSVGSLIEAREVLHVQAFDVVVLDLYLGHEMSLSVATLASYSNPDCRVIVVTGSPVFAMGELFDLAPSIVTVLRKPFRSEELLAVSEHGS